MKIGTNYHLDAFRPWTAMRGMARDVEGIASAGFDAVRVVGELVLPNETGEVADTRLLHEFVSLCRGEGLEFLALCWNVVPEGALVGHELEDDAGHRYPRGHWGLFNFMDARLREIALRSLRSITKELAGVAPTAMALQPTNEWLLAAYPPHGWYWPSYAGEMTRSEPVHVMYDEFSLREWHHYLGVLPGTWRAKILAEFGGSELKAVPPPSLEEGGWSATALAWAEFRARLIGRFLREAYEAVLPFAGGMDLLSQSTMPVLASQSGRRPSALGHNPDYWFREGRSCDYLAVNVYDSYLRITERPYFGDNDIELWSWMSLFREVVRVHGLQGLYVTEVGANSYWHTEDAQRYLVVRSVLAAAHFDLRGLFHLLWNDDPRFENIAEQFFGVARDQHLQPKAALQDLRTVVALLRASRPSEDRYSRLLACVLPRRSMDLGLEEAALDATMAIGRCMMVTTDGLVGAGGFAPEVRAAVVSGFHWVGDAQYVAALFERGLPLVVPGTLARYGTDEDDQREQSVCSLLGVAGRRRYSTCLDPVVVGVPGAGLDGRYTLTGSYELLELADSDLAPGVQVLARFGSGGIAAFSYENNIVTAFPVGHARRGWDAEITRLTVDLVQQLAGRAQLRAPFQVEGGGTPERVRVWTVGDIIVAMNTSDEVQDVVIHDDDSGLRLGLPVGPRRFSACRRSSEPDFAVLSAPGKLSVDGRVKVDLQGAVTVVLDGEMLTAYADWTRDGTRVIGVEVDGVPCEPEGSVWDDRYVGSRGARHDGTSVVVRTEERVRGTVQYRRSVRLWPPSDAEEPLNASRRRVSETETFGQTGAYGHTHFASPQSAVLKWHGSSEKPGASVRLVLRGHYGKGSSCIFDEWLPLGADIRSRPLSDVDLRLTTVTAEVRAQEGSAIPEDLEIEITYTAEEPPEVLVSTYDKDTLRVRFHHPMRWEYYEVVGTRIECLSEGRWVPVVIHTGSAGMHTRHLQRSEDWVDVRA